MRNPNNFNVEARTNRILESYRKMGFLSRSAASDLAPTIRSDMADLLSAAGSAKIEPYVPVSRIAPGISLLELINAYEPRIKDYDKSPDGAWHSPYTFVFSDLWSQYLDGELIPLGNTTTMVSAALVEGSSDGDGLFRKEQEADFDEEAISDMVAVEYLDPAAYISLSAIRRLDGRPAFGGFTHFPWLSVKEVNGQTMAPYIVSRQGDLILGQSNANSLTPGPVNTGVRFSASLIPAMEMPTERAAA